MSDEDHESSQEYKRSSFCGFNREVYNNLKRRSILYSSSSSSDQSSKGSLWENSGEDELLLLESIKQVEAKIASESMSLESNNKDEKRDNTNVEIITIDASEDDDEDTLLLTQENLPKDMVNNRQSSDIKQNNQSSHIRKNSQPSHFISKKKKSSEVSNNNKPSDVYFNNECSDFSESSKSLDGNENNEPPYASSSTDVTESYRQEIVEITKQIDALVTRSKAGKKNGLITFSYERYSKGRVKVVGQKMVSGELLKTGKHLGLSKEQAELKVVKEMLQLLEDKYFPERTCPDESLEKHEHDLVQFCKESNLSDPQFTPGLMEGKYHVTLVVGSQVSHSGPANFMKDARAIAARNWLELHGGNWRQVLDHKNLDEQESGCLVFQCSGEVDSVDQPGASHVKVQRECSDIKIVQSPIFTNNRNKAKMNSGQFPIGINCDERKAALDTGEQVNSDDVRVIQGSPEFIEKIQSCSRDKSNEGSCGDLDIFNLYSSKNPPTKIDSFNTKKPSMDQAKPKFKFAQKESVVATPLWLSQEFPHPAPENIASHSRFSSKVTDANISKECEEGSLWEDSGKDELLKSTKQVEVNIASESMSLKSPSKHEKSDHTNIEIISIDASEDEEEDTVLIAQESLSNDVVNTHKSSRMKLDIRKNSQPSDFIKEVNSDDIRITQRRPGLASTEKVTSYSPVISNEGPCGDVYSSKNPQTKMCSTNPKKPTVAQAKPKFKFTKKTSVNASPSWLSKEISVNASPSWLSKEFPHPPPENVSSSKVMESNIFGECDQAFGSKKKPLLHPVLNSSTPEKLKRSCDDDVKTSCKRPKKGSPILESIDCDEQSDLKETSFRFSSKAVELNKIFVQRKSFKPTAFVAPLKSKSVKPKNGQKEKASDIFDISDDPDVMEILKREKAEAKNVTGNAKKGSKFVKGVQKMIQFSQKLGQRKRSRLPDYCDDKEFESPAKRQRSFNKKGTNLKRSIGVSKPETLAQETEPLHDSPDSIPMSPSLMISPVLPRKLASLEEDEIDDDVENDSNEYVPDLDELLKLPERPADGSKTKDEILDEFDRQIAERQRLHEEEMARVEADIEAENQKRTQRKMRLKENAKLRNRLETELTETRLRSMFKENLEYLRDIWNGKVESSRHQAFHKSIRTRHALYYTIITDPFTDDQLDWTLDEIGKVWMSNRRDQLDNKEYVWKVLLAECFIKFYMDFFNVSKNEAMTKISETPLHKKDRLKEFMSKSDEEESEED